jgi:hypothetical protein
VRSLVKLVLAAGLLLCIAGDGLGIEVSGTITQDTVWTAGEVIEVVDDVAVDAGATLSIAPGARVEFHKSTGLTVSGGLTAHGSDGDEILLTTAVDSAGWYYDRMWDGISCEDGAHISLLHCGLSWAAIAVLADGCNLSMEKCCVENFASTGVYVRNYSVSERDTAWLHDCTIQQSAGDLLGLGTGLDVYRRFEVEVIKCRFRECYQGIQLRGYKTYLPHGTVESCEFERCSYCCLGFKSGSG